MELAGVMGLPLEVGPSEHSGRERPDHGVVTALIDRRRISKAIPDFKTADRMREELMSQGFEWIDRPCGGAECLRR